MKILFVCLGNICRSPLAEAVFNRKIGQKGLEMRLKADSCGTANYHVGQPPDPRTIKNALANGVVLHHLGRQLSESDLKDYDMIIPMDRSNYEGVLRLKDSARFLEKIHLMREFDTIGKGQDVPDPFHGNAKDFQEVFEIVDRSVDGLIDYLTKNKFTSAQRR